MGLIQMIRVSGTCKRPGYQEIAVSGSALDCWMTTNVITGCSYL